MQLFFALIPFVTLASAYQVTSPNCAAGWTTVDPNAVTWQRVSTDPLNFTLVLSNHVQTSSHQQVLAVFVDGTLGKHTVTPPSTGYLTGNDFRVMFVRDTEHLCAIYAQSGRFSIEQATTNVFFMDFIKIDKHNLMIQVKQIRQEGGGDGGGEGAGGGGGVDVPDFGDPTDDDPPDIPDYEPPDFPDTDPDSDPSGSSNLNNADRITAAGSVGLIFGAGALAAIVL